MYINIGIIISIIFFLNSILILLYKNGKLLNNTLLEKLVNNLYNNDKYSIIVLFMYILTSFLISVLLMYLYPILLLTIIISFLLKQRIKQRKQF